jgi:hypothetical protein
MQQNTLGEFAQETARIVHDQGDRLKGVEKDLEHMTRDRQRCNETHTKALEELGKLARATADAFEAHTVEHRVEAATLDRGSRNFVAVVAAIAAVVGATLPRLLEFLAGLLGLGG